MHFCGYCGKKIPDGEQCNCPESLSNRNRQAAEEIKAVAVANRRQLIIGIVCLTIIITAFVKIIVFMFSGGNEEPVVRSTRPDYEKPVTDFVSAYNRNNSEKMMKIMLPSDYIEDFKHDMENPDEWDEYIRTLNDKIEKEKDTLELDYGKNIRLSAEILDRKSLNQSETDDIKKLYEEDFKARAVKSAYKIKVEFQIEGSEDYDINKYWIYVVEVRGDGWLLCPEGDGYTPGSYIGLDPQN
ncbi:MAG: hypothetical protein NC040_07775 [Muribaculaceae bacterium]|nr:hypothetical protein [Alistipes senegalensis]MCM1473942.1 hypothetical protein [Muribaculaceae bacterium]